MPFGFPDTFEAEKPTPSWASKSPVVWPEPIKKTKPEEWQEDQAKKRLFGIELAKNENAFEAACKVYATTNQALWASTYLISDPIVLEAKAEYNSVDQQELLDRDGLSRKLLQFADERDITGKFYIVDAKDRLAALALYAKIRGYTNDSVNIDASTNNQTNVMKIVLVKPEDKQPQKTIEAKAVSVDRPQLTNIKLVANS